MTDMQVVTLGQSMQILCNMFGVTPFSLVSYVCILSQNGRIFINHDMWDCFDTRFTLVSDVLPDSCASAGRSKELRKTGVALH